MNILAQFPTLGRPDKFLSCFKKYVDMSSGKHNLLFNINCDYADKSMNNDMISYTIRDVVRNKTHINTAFNFDFNTTKISSINAHIATDFDIVLIISDDMIPQTFNWDDEVASAMTTHFPQLDGCIHFNDGYTSGKLITFSILGRKLYEEFGYLYHPDYKSLYCDNEFTQEVNRIGRVEYVDKVIIKHEHYGEKNNSNSGDFDETAKKTLVFSGRDHQVFEARKRLGFPKERITDD